MADCYEAAGRLDYLVNAAGVLLLGRDRSLVDMDLDVWDDVLAINLKGSMLAAREAVPLMKRTGGGAMVHIATIQCVRGDDAPQDGYQASKAGLVAMSKSIAIQFAGDGIRSNTILPGPTETPMQRRWVDNPALREATEAAVPLRPRRHHAGHGERHAVPALGRGLVRHRDRADRRRRGPGQAVGLYRSRQPASGRRLREGAAKRRAAVAAYRESVKDGLALARPSSLTIPGAAGAARRP